jgi:hypothetical protein
MTTMLIQVSSQRATCSEPLRETIVRLIVAVRAAGWSMVLASGAVK